MTRRLRQIAASPVVTDLAVVLAAWTALALVIEPVGNFPLDDDWSYGRSVELLVNHGRFDLVFAAVPLITQVLWGSLFTAPTGFSFEALRVSVWTLGAVGLVATYSLLTGLNVSRRVALMGTFVLALNPLYLVLALTFMTDVPSLALSIVALALLARGAVTGSRRILVAGAAVLLLALLVRQPALAVAAGTAVAWLAAHRRSAGNLLTALAIPLGALAVVIGYEVVIRRTIGLPPLYNQPYDPISQAGRTDIAGIVGPAVERMAVMLVYIGLFSLPLSLVVLGARWRRATAAVRGRLAAAGIVLTVSALAVLSGGSIHPYGNFIHDSGVGPPLLRDTYLLGLDHLPTMPQVAWIGATLAGVVGAGLLTWLTFVALLDRSAAGRSSMARPVVLAALVTAVTYLGFLVVAGFLDRYLVWLLPPALVVVAAAHPIAAAASRRWFAAGAIVLAGIAVFGVAAGHDYFAWNRSRWAALHYLDRALGVPSSRIDGGFEFNGWYGFDPSYRERPGLSWWWVQDDVYLVTFGPVAGYAEVARFAYRRWFPPGDGAILVLRRLGTEEPGG